MNSINEMVLTILTNNKDKIVNSAIIINNLSANSMGTLQLKPIELRQIIKHLRFGGHPIIANNKGYKYTTNKQDLMDYIASRKLELESELLILSHMGGKW